MITFNRGPPHRSKKMSNHDNFGECVIAPGSKSRKDFAYNLSVAWPFWKIKNF